MTVVIASLLIERNGKSCSFKEVSTIWWQFGAWCCTKILILRRLQFDHISWTQTISLCAWWAVWWNCMWLTWLQIYMIKDTNLLCPLCCQWHSKLTYDIVFFQAHFSSSPPTPRPPPLFQKKITSIYKLVSEFDIYLRGLELNNLVQLQGASCPLCLL